MDEPALEPPPPPQPPPLPPSALLPGHHRHRRHHPHRGSCEGKGAVPQAACTIVALFRKSQQTPLRILARFDDSANDLRSEPLPLPPPPSNEPPPLLLEKAQSVECLTKWRGRTPNFSNKIMKMCSDSGTETANSWKEDSGIDASND